MRVFYFGFFQNDKNEFLCNAAANQVSKYLAKQILNFNEKSIVINCSPYKNNFKMISGYAKPFANFNFFNLPAFRVGRVFNRLFNKILTIKNIIKFVKNNVHPGDKIIIYHSLQFLKLYKYFYKKNIKFTVQLEEIYSDANDKFMKMRTKELLWINKAESFILASKTLANCITDRSKRNIILYGAYNTFDYKKFQKFKFKLLDGKNHLVYCGTFDKLKGGLYNAIEFLNIVDSSYVLHVLGKGDFSSIVCNYKKFIDDNRLIMHGFKSGEDLLEFLSKCDIGLALQNPNASFNDTSFPSKILTYLSAGLTVISTRSSSVEKSDIAKNVIFLDYNNCSNLKKEIEVMKVINKDIIKQLDDSFCKELYKFLTEE